MIAQFMQMSLICMCPLSACFWWCDSADHLLGCSWYHVKFSR